MYAGICITLYYNVNQVPVTVLEFATEIHSMLGNDFCHSYPNTHQQVNQYRILQENLDALSSAFFFGQRKEKNAEEKGSRKKRKCISRSWQAPKDGKSMMFDRVTLDGPDGKEERFWPNFDTPEKKGGSLQLGRPPKRRMNDAYHDRID